MEVDAAPTGAAAAIAAAKVWCKDHLVITSGSNPEVKARMTERCFKDLYRARSLHWARCVLVRGEGATRRFVNVLAAVQPTAPFAFVETADAQCIHTESDILEDETRIFFTAAANLIVMDSFAPMRPRATPVRLALVIANSSYTHSDPLPNSLNDAAAMVASLRRLGYPNPVTLINENAATRRRTGGAIVSSVRRQVGYGAKGTTPLSRTDVYRHPMGRRQGQSSSCATPSGP